MRRDGIILYRLFWLSKHSSVFVRGWSHNDFPFLVGGKQMKAGMQGNG